MDSTIARSVLLFVLAGLCEIGGGYLVWLWLREGRAVWLGAIGGLILFLYGVLPTLQPAGASFGRVYAAYGGIFVVLSLAWSWWIDTAYSSVSIGKISGRTFEWRYSDRATISFARCTR